MNTAFFAVGVAFLVVGVATVATGNGVVWSTFFTLGVVFLVLAYGADRDDAENADPEAADAPSPGGDEDV